MNPPWIKYLPSALRTRIENGPVLLGILDNTGWLFADKVLRLAIGLFVGVWLARYLGPEQYGLMNYAIAIVGLFGAIASLGFSGIVVRDLVRAPDTANATLGTAFLLQVLGGFLAFVLAIAVIGFARPEDDLARLMVAVLGFSMVFKAADVVKYWFESRVASRYVVWVESGVLIGLAAVKVWFILIEAPLITFVWVLLAEVMLASIGLMGMYVWRGGALGRWHVRVDRAKSLLRDSWPMILSGLAVMVYMRIDQVMLGQILGDEAVGIYSVAVRISEVWYFMPMAIVASVFPSIVQARQQDEMAYYHKLQKLHNLMVLLALIVAIPTTFLSDWLVVFLFGEPYRQAGAILALHVWTGLFVFLGVASSSWYLSENLQTLAFYRTLLGVSINILANWMLIPAYGVLGAAWGTILSQLAAAYLFDGLNAGTRRMFRMKTTAIISFYKVF